MTVGNVDEQAINPGFQQRCRTVQVVAPCAYGSGHQQVAVVILAGVGTFPQGKDIAPGDQPAYVPLVIDQRQALNAVFEQDAGGLLNGNAGFVDNQPVEGGHEAFYRLVIVVAVPGHIPLRQQPGQDVAARFRLDQDAGDRMVVGEVPGLLNGSAQGQAQGLVDDCALAAFYLGNLARLPLDGHGAVDHAYAAFHCHGPGHVRAGHAVHIGRDDGQFQGDAVGQDSSQADVPARTRHPFLRAEQEVVESFSDPESSIFSCHEEIRRLNGAVMLI